MKKDLTSVIGYIYKITSPNNKIYIGQTINKKQRKYQYKSNSFKGQIKLWNNVQKYNWNPVKTFEIIEECLCGENKIFLNEREQYWIKHFDSFKNGLNCNKGGHGNLGYKASDETKLKMRESAKNKPPVSDETKLKMRESAKNKPETTNTTKELLRELNLGEKNPMFNKKHSLDAIKKIKESKIDFKHSEESKEKMRKIPKPPMSDETKELLRQINLGKTYETKKINQIDENGKIIKTWNGVSECAKNLNLHISGISQVLTGKSKTTKGYRFEYII